MKTMRSTSPTQEIKTYYGMKSIKISLLWTLLLGSVAFNLVNSFVLVDAQSAYVENETLFNQFKLTQEYRTKLEGIKQERQAVLDSLETKIRQEQIGLNEQSSADRIQVYQKLVLEYESLKERFNDQNSTLETQYEEAIWKQLNSYIRDFGEDKGYNMILGASGNGNVMYADNALNVTEELIVHVNNRYDGK